MPGSTAYLRASLRAAAAAAAAADGGARAPPVAHLPVLIIR